MGRPLCVSVAGIGLLGPGFGGWEAGRAVLAGYAPWEDGAMPAAKLAVLPPAERRRCPPAVRIALAAAQEALSASGLAAHEVVTVFGASDVDGDLTHAAYQGLAADPPRSSPTRFQNSVHNAAAGYWGIATRSPRASTSISAYDWTFAATLLDAVTQATVEDTPVLAVVCDMPAPRPLSALRPMDAGLAVALVLRPGARPGAVAVLEVAFEAAAGRAESMHAVPGPLRRTPAARALPLLAAVAGRATGVVTLGYLDDAVLRVTVR